MKKKFVLNTDSVIKIEQSLLQEITAIRIQSNSASYQLAYTIESEFRLEFKINTEYKQKVDTQLKQNTTPKKQQQTKQTKLWSEDEPQPQKSTYITYACIDSKTQLRHVLHKCQPSGRTKKSSTLIPLYTEYWWIIAGHIPKREEYTKFLIHRLRKSPHILVASGLTLADIQAIEIPLI